MRFMKHTVKREYKKNPRGNSKVIQSNSMKEVIPVNLIGFQSAPVAVENPLNDGKDKKRASRNRSSNKDPWKTMVAGLFGIILIAVGVIIVAIVKPSFSDDESESTPALDTFLSTTMAAAATITTKKASTRRPTTTTTRRLTTTTTKRPTTTTTTRRTTTTTKKTTKITTTKKTTKRPTTKTTTKRPTIKTTAKRSTTKTTTKRPTTTTTTKRTTAKTTTKRTTAKTTTKRPPTPTKLSTIKIFKPPPTKPSPPAETIGWPSHIFGTKLTDDQCGIRLNTEGVGNTRRWPWLVNLVKTKPGTDVEKEFCSGTIISPIHVVTAMSCLWDMKEDEILNTVGAKYGQEIENVTSRYMGFAKVQHHPDNSVKPKRPVYDMSVLTFKERLPLDGKSFPICFPHPREKMYHQIHETSKKYCDTVSWNAAIKRRTRCQMNYILQKPCKVRHGTWITEESAFCGAGIFKCRFCLSRVNRGSPMICMSNNRWILQGIMSYNSKCESEYVLFAQVSTNMRWFCCFFPKMERCTFTFCLYDVEY